MRTALLLGLVTLIASTSTVACVMEDAGGASRRPKSVANNDDDDADEEGDDADEANGGDVSVGSTKVDPGNPNANTPPAAPTNPGQAAQGFSLALDKDTPTVDLGTDTTINVTVEPKGGFTGKVDVAVTGLPAGVTAAPASGAPGTPIAIKLTAAYNAQVTPKTGAVPLVIEGTSAGQKATANANFKVLPKLEVHIPVNAQALLAAGNNVDFGPQYAAGAAPMKTQADNPIVMTIKNDDSANRVIHFPGALGHGDANNPIKPGQYEMQGGAPRVRSLKPGTNSSGYFHGVTNGQNNSLFRLSVAQ